MALKIAYICICHTDPNFVARTAKALQYKEDGFFIHVDNKVDITPFVSACNDMHNAHFVQDRIDNYWGGYNSIIATMRTIQLALSTDNYDRFVILQGQDYPLFSPKKIHDFFENHKDIEFCRAKNISTSSNKRDYMKCCGFWMMDGKPNFIQKCLRVFLVKLNKLGIKYRRSTFKNGKEKWSIYHGKAHIALTRDCIQYILNVYNSNMHYNKYMKHRFPPDESYMHTIVHNSPFKDKVSKKIVIDRFGKETLFNLTYLEYPVYATVFTQKDDYQWLKDMGCLFVRKVNSTSVELLDEIDKHIL